MSPETALDILGREIQESQAEHPDAPTRRNYCVWNVPLRHLCNVTHLAVFLVGKTTHSAFPEDGKGVKRFPPHLWKQAGNER